MPLVYYCFLGYDRSNKLISQIKGLKYKTFFDTKIDPLSPRGDRARL